MRREGRHCGVGLWGLDLQIYSHSAVYINLLLHSHLAERVVRCRAMTPRTQQRCIGVAAAAGRGRGPRLERALPGPLECRLAACCLACRIAKELQAVAKRIAHKPPRFGAQELC